MKINTKSLAGALANLRPIFSGGKNSMIYASHVKLKISKGLLTLIATNLDEWQIERVAAEGTMDDVCLNHRHLETCIGGESVEITMDGNKVKICYDKSVKRLPVMQQDTFPQMPPFSNPINHGLSRDNLADGIDRVKFATIEAKGNVAVLENVHVLVAGKSLSIEAANGPHVAWHRDTVKAGPVDILIPRAFCDGLSNALRRANTEVEIYDGWIEASHDDGSYCCKLAEGKYMEMQKVWDSMQGEIGEIEVGRLLPILHSVTALCSDAKYPAATLSFSPLGLRVESKGDYDVSDEVSGQFIEHTASINCRVVSIALNSLKSERCMVNMAGPHLVFQTGKSTVFCGGMLPIK